METDPHYVAIVNMRDTAKWLIGSVGAVFVVLLAGVQFSRAPFASDPVVVSAAVAAVSGVMITFILAIRTLAGGGFPFRDLATKRSFRSTRRYINEAWAERKGSDQVKLLWETLCKEDDEIRAGTIDEADPYYMRISARVDEVLAIARWYDVKGRFKVLVIAIMILIPLELVATGMMVSRQTREYSETTVIIRSPER